MGYFSDGRVAEFIDNSVGPALAIAFNNASKEVITSTEVRWSFEWQGSPARVTLGGSGFSSELVDGTVTSFTFEVDGNTIYSLTDIGVRRSTIAELVHVNNGAALLATLYGGNDTFKLTRAGTHYALYGAEGDDTFNFGDSLTAEDIVVGGAGEDTLSLGGDYTLSLTDAMMREVESLSLASGGSYDITFADGNVARGERLTISGATLGVDDVLVINGSLETNGRFTVNAGAGDDEIIGGAFGDTLNGGAGADTLAGGLGADILKGGLGADVLQGGGGTDTLNGENGHDRLLGGAGGDRFLFDLSDAVHSDTIVGFSHVQGDRIHLENSAFIALGTTTGALAAEQFRVGAAARDADDHIIYNATTGRLYYDEDGSGANAKILIAILTANPALQAADFVVI